MYICPKVTAQGLIPKAAETRGRILRSAVFWRLLVFKKDSRKPPRQIAIFNLLNRKIRIKKEYPKDQNPVRNPDHQNRHHPRTHNRQQNHYQNARRQQ